MNLITFADPLKHYDLLATSCNSTKMMSVYLLDQVKLPETIATVIVTDVLGSMKSFLASMNVSFSCLTSKARTFSGVL